MNADFTHDAYGRLAQYIPAESLPGDRDDLIAGATELNAPDDIIDTLERLPEEEVFETVAEVWTALHQENAPS